MRRISDNAREQNNPPLARFRQHVVTSSTNCMGEGPKHHAVATPHLRENAPYRPFANKTSLEESLPLTWDRPASVTAPGNGYYIADGQRPPHYLRHNPDLRMNS